MRLRGGDILLFGCVDRNLTSPESSEQNNDKLNSLLKSISSKTYRHINWTPWSTPCGENSSEGKFVEALHDSYLHQHVKKTTRRRGNDDPSLLDLILTDGSMQVSEIADHAPLGKSDHGLLTFAIYCYLDFIKRKERCCFDRDNYEGMDTLEHQLEK